MRLNLPRGNTEVCSQGMTETKHNATLGRNAMKRRKRGYWQQERNRQRWLTRRSKVERQAKALNAEADEAYQHAVARDTK